MDHFNINSTENIKNLLLSHDYMKKIKGIQCAVKEQEFSVMGMLLLISSNDKSNKVRYLARKSLAYLNHLKGFDAPNESAGHDSEKSGNAQNKDINQEDKKRGIKTVKKVLLTGTAQEKLNILANLFLKKENFYLPAVSQALLKESDEKVISAMLVLLGYYGDSSHLYILKDFFTHENHRIRANAVEAAGYIGKPTVFDEHSFLANDNDNRVLANYALAVSPWKKEQSIEILDKMAKSQKIELLDSALYALGRCNHKQAPGLLKIIADSCFYSTFSDIPCDHYFQIGIKALKLLLLSALRGFKEALIILENKTWAQKIFSNINNRDIYYLLFREFTKNMYNPVLCKPPDINNKNINNKNINNKNINNINNINMSNINFRALTESKDFILKFTGLIFWKRSLKSEIDFIDKIKSILKFERDPFLTSRAVSLCGELIDKPEYSVSGPAPENCISRQNTINSEIESIVEIIKKYTHAGDYRTRANAIEFVQKYAVKNTLCAAENLKEFLFSWNHRISLSALVSLYEQEPETVLAMVKKYLYTETDSVLNGTIRAAGILKMDIFKNRLIKLSESENKTTSSWALWALEEFQNKP